MKLLILILLFGHCAAGVFQHRLIWRESKRIKMMKEGAWEAYVSQKSSTSENVDDYEDMEYLANITIGTPPQNFLVQLDTGSSDLWIPDSTCAECSSKNKFNADNSSTYTKIGTHFQITYEDESNANGYTAQDVVAIAGENGAKLEIPNSIFAQATYVSSEMVKDFPDGIFGLGLQGLSSTHSLPPLINALNKKLLDKPIFTVFLEERGDEDNVPGGFVTYGNIDSEHCSTEVDYHPLVSDSEYMISMQAISLGNFTANDEYTLLSDTGTSFIGGPPDVVRALAKAAGAIRYSGDDYRIDCEAEFGPIKLSINSKVYEIPSKQVKMSAGNGICAFAFFEIEDLEAGDWVFGDPLMRSYCQVYGMQDKTLGFAKIIS